MSMEVSGESRLRIMNRFLENGSSEYVPWLYQVSIVLSCLDDGMMSRVTYYHWISSGSQFSVIYWHLMNLYCTILAMHHLSRVP